MSTIASTSLRQASRLCPKQARTAGRFQTSTFLQNAAIRGIRISRRGYVSESKKDSAQVNAETAVRPDQKAFFPKTGKLSENISMQGTTAGADAMMSPIAGGFV
jgi:cysteine desulfurase